jgi:crossover junction endodeoxyribonuclease RuvC
MIAFGIDPGSQITGYGIIEKNSSKLLHIDNGVVRPGAKLPFARRLQEIHDRISSLLARYQPDIVVLEDIFVAKNVKSSIKLGQARGVTMLAAAKAGLEIAEYTPAQVKQAVVGVGNATKNQVQIMVKAHLKLPEVAAEDAADALAVAICHLHSCTLRNIIKNI